MFFGITNKLYESKVNKIHYLKKERSVNQFYLKDYFFKKSEKKMI